MTEVARRRSRSRALGLIAAAGLATVLATGPSKPGAADTPVEAGWWMAPIGVAPDAPADGLVVQGGPAGDLAYGAVRFALASDGVPEQLILRVAPDSASTPNTTLVLCPVTEPFTPAQGGPMADAPAYDCEISVQAAPSTDGTTYMFEVAAMVAGGELAVAILPTAATDRIVLSAPGTYSLTGADTVVTPPATDPSSPDAPPTGPLEAFAPPAPVGDAPTFPPVATPTVDVASTPTVAPPLVAAPAAAAAPTAPQSGSGGGSSLPPLLFLGLAAAAAGLWGAAGARDELSAQPAG